MEEKSREEVLAARKLRKAAKQSKKQNSSNKPSGDQKSTTNELNEKLKNLDISEAKNSTASKESLSKTGPPSNLKITNSSDVQKNVIEKDPAKPAGNDVESKEKDHSNQKDGNQKPETVKSKAQLKAERRAIQEAQRALKAHKKIKDEVKSENSESVKSKAVSVDKENINKKVTPSNDPSRVKLVSHLYPDDSFTADDFLKKCRPEIHKSITKLGLQYKDKIIIGSNARVVALLNTLKEVLSDFQGERNFSREFETILDNTLQYLTLCRPPSVSMTNAIKHFKGHLTQLPNNISSQEAKIKLREVIDKYIDEQIDTAGKAIVSMVQKKISENDVILTYGYSSLIERILTESFQIGIKFRVIIVDGGPLDEGKELLRRLAKRGLHCTYVLITASNYIMKDATKVLLGAHALLANGYVKSRVGSMQVALIARSFNVPVLVCCETHKFSESVQTDALVHNEIVEPSPSILTEKLKPSRYLKFLGLMYDVTPPDLVTAVVTELAILPCTSVPVVLRVKPANPTLS